MSNQKLAEALRAVLPAAKANALRRETIEAAEAALAEYDAQLPGYTVCLQADANQSDRTTTHVTYQPAATRDEAVAAAMDECRSDWEEDAGFPLHVLAVLRGDVDVVEWEDQQ